MKRLLFAILLCQCGILAAVSGGSGFLRLLNGIAFLIGLSTMLNHED